MTLFHKTGEFILDNGLKVLLHPIQGVPVITVMVWYKVGSRNETKGKTGISHFLEHLSFKNTELFDRGKMVSEIVKNGGYYNAYTSRDFTCYYETFSADRLELALIIESQRMNHLILNSSERDIEVGIILSEMEKSFDNPYNALDTGLREKAYLYHPYRNPVVGHEEDIESITVDDLYEYYRSFYSPNNAVIVIAGNFDSKQALNSIKKYFGKIPAGKIPAEIPKEPPQKTTKRAVVKKKGFGQIIKLAYHIPSASHEDIYPLSVLGEFLNVGISGRLYQSVVETRLATDISVNTEVLKDPGLFTFTSTLFPDTEASEAEATIFREIEKIFDIKSSEDEELEKIKNRIKSSFEFNRDGIFKYAYMLGYYEVVNSYKYIENYIDQIQKITVNDIKRAAEKYLDPLSCTVGEFVPSRHDTAKLVPEYTYKPIETLHHSYHSPPFIIKEKIEPFSLKFSKIILKNGLKILYFQNKTSNTVKLAGSINAGNIHTSDVSPILPVMCAGMLNRGSKGMSKREIADFVEFRGASAGIGSVGENVSFSLSATADDFPYIFEILAKILREPVFPENEYEKYRQFAAANIRQKRFSTEHLANAAFSRLVFPEGHMLYQYSLPTQEKFLFNLCLDEIISFYNGFYSPDGTIMALSGNISSDKLENLAEKYFGSWDRKFFTNAKPKKACLQKTFKEKTVKVKNKTEAQVVWGHYCNLTRTSPDYHSASVMNFILGGSSPLSSRIGLKIREDLGLAYSISSCFNFFSIPGAWFVKFGVDSHYADIAIKALDDEVRTFLDKGITDQELDMAKSYLIGSYPLRFSNNTGIAKALLANEFYGLKDEYLSEYPMIIEKITKKEVMETARKYIHPDVVSVVKAGDF